MASQAVVIAGSASKAVQKIFLRKGGVWKELTKGFLRKGDQWVQIFDNGYIPPAPPVVPEPETVNYLAVGYDGYVYTSDDGVTFTIGSRVFHSSKKAIVCDGTWYYVCEINAGAPNAKKSRDGVSWTSISSFPQITIGDFAWDGKNFVVAQSGGRSLFYTTDVDSLWSEMVMQISNPLTSPKLQYVKNLDSWYVAESGFSSVLYKVSSLGGEFSALPDAANLSQTSLPMVESGKTLYALFNIRKATGSAHPDTIGYAIKASGDGVSYNTVTSGTYLSDGKDVVATQNAVVTQVGAPSNAVTAKAPINFERVSLPYSLDFTGDSNYNSTRVGVVNAMFYAIGNRDSLASPTDASDISVAAYSSNGTQWGATTMLAHNSVVWHTVVGGRAYCCSADGLLQTTGDGINWVKATGLSNTTNVSKCTIASKKDS